MSWLTGLTSKAENFLTKIDQTAATTLQTEPGSSLNSTQRIGEIDRDVLQQDMYAPANRTFPMEQPMANMYKPNVSEGGQSRMVDPPALKSSYPTVSSPTATRIGSRKGLSPTSSDSNLYRSSSTPSLKKDDEMLFEFLNSAPTTSKMGHTPSKLGHTRNYSDPKTSTPTVTPRKAPQVPSQPLKLDLKPAVKLDSVVTQSVKDSDAAAVIGTSDADANANPPQTTVAVDDSTSNMEPLTDPPPDPQPTQVASSKEPIQNSKSALDIVNDRLSNAELENQLLKKEMQTTNEELASTLTKLKEAQEEATSYRKRYENRRSQQNEDYERQQEEFKNREADLNEALRAKDSQLAVLRVRIQEVDAELKSKTDTLEQIQDQNQRILKDQSDASDVQSGALESVRLKLEESDSQLRQEREENERMKKELMDVRQQLESEQIQYADNIKQLQTKHIQEKEKLREFDVSLKTAQDMSDNYQQELKEYKEKAARILQAKEKLIMSLKQGTSSSEPHPAILTELEELRQDRDMIRDELQQNKYKLEQLRSEYMELDNQHHTESEEMGDRIQHLESVLQDEQRKRQSAEEDMKRYMQELHHAREDLQKQRLTNVAQLQEKDGEIQRLQKQVAVKQTMGSSQEELENRIRVLTDNLIEKQTVVEALGTEKNSLVLQLERLEKQYLDVQSSLTRRNKDLHHHDAHSIEEADYGPRLQPMASIMPPQITGNRRWKTTVNQIDVFSIRLGVFLRRYPAARLLVILYMFLLHLWVSFVILTYTPEMHSSRDFDPHPKER